MVASIGTTYNRGGIIRRIPGFVIEKESVIQAPRLLKAPAATAAKPSNVVTVT